MTNKCFVLVSQHCAKEGRQVDLRCLLSLLKVLLFAAHQKQTRSRGYPSRGGQLLLLSAVLHLNAQIHGHLFLGFSGKLMRSRGSRRNNVPSVVSVGEDGDLLVGGCVHSMFSSSDGLRSESYSNRIERYDHHDFDHFVCRKLCCGSSEQALCWTSERSVTSESSAAKVCF